MQSTQRRVPSVLKDRVVTGCVCKAGPALCLGQTVDVEASCLSSQLSYSHAHCYCHFTS